MFAGRKAENEMRLIIKTNNIQKSRAVSPSHRKCIVGNKTIVEQDKEKKV